MATINRPMVDAASYFENNQHASPRDLSEVAAGLVGSEILKISADIRAMQAAGKPVLNLTVGDFSPKEFPVPQALTEASISALQAGQTNYPPSDGVLELRQAIQHLYARELGLSYPLSSIVVQSGGRPGIYATYRALLNPGDTVIYPMPSWNNNHYSHLVGATPIEIETRREEGFLPTAEALAPHIGAARLICLNSPLNPTGTVIEPERLRAICELVLEENARRVEQERPALYLLFDQIYWMLTFGDAHHYTPPEVAPEMINYTILVDGISKGFAATGLRVGWTIAPPVVAAPLKDIIAHIGAWAPKPVQLATAELLNDVEAIHEYHGQMKTEVQARLNALYEGFQTMRAEGLPVDCMAPEGAIYLSAQLDLIGRSVDGETFTTNDDIRRFVLDSAGFGVVPFGAFGFKEQNGWFRISVGAVSRQEIASGLPRLRDALRQVR
ncbi:MAG TPA: aminotransferase class I/II-fold pyridoxal phosphate-dependent enzyme [Herpetosiphonaceae bacterium]